VTLNYRDLEGRTRTATWAEVFESAKRIQDFFTAVRHRFVERDEQEVCVLWAEESGCSGGPRNDVRKVGGSLGRSTFSERSATPLSMCVWDREARGPEGFGEWQEWQV